MQSSTRILQSLYASQQVGNSPSQQPSTINHFLVTSSVDTSYSDADKIIQNTWTSRQEIPCSNTVSVSPDESAVVAANILTNRLTLQSSDLSETLPSNSSDSVCSLVVSQSDLSSDNNNVDSALISPSLQISPPTPDLETEGWVLVNEENQSNSKQLPSDSETCRNDSSLLSNSSFLHSDRVPGPHTNSLSELPGSFSEGNSPDSSMTSMQNSSEEVTWRNKRLSKHSRGASWSDDSKTQQTSGDSESSDGVNNTVRRRLSSFFGSFGKGGRTKEKSESLFYDYPDEPSQLKSSDSDKNSITSLNESTTYVMSNNNDLDSKQSLSVNNHSCDRDSNRSSMSDESFDTEQRMKSDGPTPESEADILDRRRKECYNIVNELMTSERVFIDVLKLICCDFKKAVTEASNLEKTPIIPEALFDKIINHLPELLFLNTDLLKDIEARIESWDKSPKVADVIVKKGPFLKLFSCYIIDYETRKKLLEECCEKYRKFGQVVTEFEKSDRCGKLPLSQHMLKPIQRIPQYQMLLEKYLKYQEPDSPDYADTQVACKIVCDAANHANSQFNQDVSTRSNITLVLTLFY